MSISEHGYKYKFITCACHIDVRYGVAMVGVFVLSSVCLSISCGQLLCLGRKRMADFGSAKGHFSL